MTDALGDGDVDIWLANPATVDDSLTAALEGVLSEGERERARAFRFAPYRRDFIASHALLRIVLARYI